MLVGVHTGAPDPWHDVGEDVYRAARIAAAVSGGEVLVSVLDRPLTSWSTRARRSCDVCVVRLAPADSSRRGASAVIGRRVVAVGDLPLVVHDLLSR